MKKKQVSKDYYTYASKEELMAVGVPEDLIYENVSPHMRKILPNYHTLNAAEMTVDQCKKMIPEGIYCYFDETKICPFWDSVHNFPEQSNGYCHFLGEGDWQAKGFSLLWDQVKECRVNER